MTDTPLDSIERKAHEACPCRNTSIRASCRYSMEFEGCACTDGPEWKKYECEWPGHALLHELRREAFNAGLEKVIELIDTLIPAGPIVKGTLDAVVIDIRALKERP